MFILENDKLKIAVKKEGAELCAISATKTGKDFMWDANPDVWNGYAPNLFPIIGGLKNGTYNYNNAQYKMDKHGFVRGNKDIILQEQTNNSLTFKLASNGELFKVYPFKFEFYIIYILQDNCLVVRYEVKNCDTKTMYFSVGGHPAFKCPVYENENYNDYSLVFEHKENSETHLINLETGLQTSETVPVFANSKTIPLHYDLFKRDALIFKDLKSKKVSLQSKINGDILSVRFDDFPYLGIWAKPNADYVCIEPWLGIADSEDSNQNFIEKEGIIALEANNDFKSQFSITIHDKHLS